MIVVDSHKTLLSLAHRLMSLTVSAITVPYPDMDMWNGHIMFIYI